MPARKLGLDRKVALRCSKVSRASLMLLRVTMGPKYFTTKPYAFDPLSLPTYPPNKEIDAKSPEEARKKKLSGRARGLERSRKVPKKPSISKLAPAEALPVQAQDIHQTKINGNIALFPSEEDNVAGREPKVLVEKIEEGFSC